MESSQNELIVSSVPVEAREENDADSDNNQPEDVSNSTAYVYNYHPLGSAQDQLIHINEAHGLSFETFDKMESAIITKRFANELHMTREAIENMLYFLCLEPKSETSSVSILISLEQMDIPTEAADCLQNLHLLSRMS